MKHTITITRKDFKNSSYLSCTNCSCAKAVKRVFPRADVRVGGSYFIINNFYIYYVDCTILNKNRHPLDNLGDLVMDYTRGKGTRSLTFTFDAKLLKH